MYITAVCVEKFKSLIKTLKKVYATVDTFLKHNCNAQVLTASLF